MNRLFACCLLAGAAVAAYPHSSLSASSPVPAADVDILVGGVPQRRYAHDGRWYVEAIKGREYAIRLRNPYGVRVAVALSVDGLNTIDARQTTAVAAKKWVLQPYQTVTISGWQTSQTHARRFEFTTEERSYGQALGKTANLGVIAAVFFKERAQPVVMESFSERARPEAPMPAAPAQDAAASGAGQSASKRADNEYAATGMGRRTGHAVETVYLDLEDTPAASMSIRYEFRPQLVRLGVLPRDVALDPLQRRERASGFDGGFAPEVPSAR
jgi:hypothetical protein